MSSNTALERLVVRLRFDLRRALRAGRPDEARATLERFRAVSRSAEHATVAAPGTDLAAEIERWEAQLAA